MDHVLRCIKGMQNYGLWYRHVERVRIEGFTNANWVGTPHIGRVIQVVSLALGQQLFPGSIGRKY